MQKLEGEVFRKAGGEAARLRPRPEYLLGKGEAEKSALGFAASPEISRIDRTENSPGHYDLANERPPLGEYFAKACIKGSA